MTLAFRKWMAKHAFESLEDFRRMKIQMKLVLNHSLIQWKFTILRTNWLFIVCHVWKRIPTIYELIYSEDGLELKTWPNWLTTIKHLSHTLIAFNSAVNFLIYALL